MNTSNDHGECKRRCWTYAAIAGGVLFLVLWLLTSWGFFGALILGLIVFALGVFFLPNILCSDSRTEPEVATPRAATPAPAPTPEPAAAENAPAAEEPAPAPEPAPAAAPEPVAEPSPAAAGPMVSPSKPLPGQQELAERKGTWRYESSQPAAAAARPAPAATADPAIAAAPAQLEAARAGGADDLKLIKGVGPKMEKMLNGMGFFHFDQIAGWTASEVAWVDENLEGFKGRVSRDNWVEQARTLATGEETEFARKAKKDKLYE